MVESAIETIDLSLKVWEGEKTNRIKVIFVDLDDGSVNPRNFMAQVKNVINKYDPHGDVKIDVIALSSAPDDRIKEKCDSLNMKYLSKPVFELMRVMKDYLH